MKADHRKELQTNWLADSLGNALQQAKEGPSQKALLYGGLVLVVAVLVGVFIWYSTHSKDADALLWVQWNQVSQGPKGELSDVEKKKLQDEYPEKQLEWLERLHALETFAAEHPGTLQARFARFETARLLLEHTEAIGSKLFLNRETTLKCIAKARDLYDKLSDESGDVPALAEEAIFNSAKASEDLGEFDRAKKNYERLKNEYPKSQYGSAADKALARLKGEQDDFDELKKLAELKKGE
jgi:hypothetical protein